MSARTPLDTTRRARWSERLWRGSVCALAAAIMLGAPDAKAQARFDVTVEPVSELLEKLKAQLTRNRAAVLVDMISFKMTRTDHGNATLNDKKKTLRRWQLVLVRALRDRDFQTVSDRTLRQEAGLTRERMRDLMVKAQPFGERDLAAQRLSEDLFFLVNEDSRPCNDGAVAAFVTGYNPEDQVQSDYGSIIVALIGAGQCGQARSRNERYLGDVKAELQRAFVKALARWEDR